VRRIRIVAIAVVVSASTLSTASAQTRDQPESTVGSAGKMANHYPTMMDMTFPEFAAAVKKSDIALLSIGAIEEHGPNLPLATDSIVGVAQLVDVQRYLQQAGVGTIVGPPINIGITNEAGDWTRDGTYIYPGSMTLGADTFVRLYIDLLRSLHDNGLRRVFLVSGHLGGRHLMTVARIAEEANRQIQGMQVYALIDSDRAEQLKLKSSTSLVLIEEGRSPKNMTELLGKGTEGAPCMHADGCEVSLMLHYYPEMVRPGYQKLSEAPPSHFFEAGATGDISKDPTGAGGLPFDRASAAVGKEIADYRTRHIGDTIKQLLRDKRQAQN
jgi:creatinine amidohydrolase